jgi:omega-6 fatty acid desaturase (delta-12 desaturase)
MSNTPTASLQEPLPSMAELNKILAPYKKSELRKSIWQLTNTLVPYLILWVLMALSLQVSYALTLLLAVFAAGFMVRLFIFFHDCGHNSFFDSVKLNKQVGFWLGILVFTPGEHWWHSHAIHHATSGNLDKRGTGDVATLTLEEYTQSAFGKRLGYKFFRHPLVMFGLGPLYMFLFLHRLPIPAYGKKETNSVILTNLGILILAVLISLVIGWKAYLMIQLPVLWMAGAFGIWLFYIQHQFEETYWQRDEEWNYIASALLGASFYRLPGILQWFSGNIGYHHIHHLAPRIPNYNLDRVYASSDLLQKWAHKIDFGQGWRQLRLKVWDEPLRKLVNFPKQNNASRPG